MINKQDLERYMQIADDARMEFVYNKDDGTWSWHNKDDGTWSWRLRYLSGDGAMAPHPTFWDCLQDAVAPYIEEEEENQAEAGGSDESFEISDQGGAGEVSSDDS